MQYRLLYKKTYRENLKLASTYRYIQYNMAGKISICPL